MPKFTTIATPIYANPKDFPASAMKKLKTRLKTYFTKDIGPQVKRDMEATVQNWRGKPIFVLEYSEPWGAHMQVRIFPKGPNTLKWQRVSEGTGPRIIRAKSQRGMRFPRDYDPKTTPGGKYGGPGRKHGDIVVAQAVYHQTTARKFTEYIKKKREKQFVDGVQEIVNQTGRL